MEDESATQLTLKFVNKELPTIKMSNNLVQAAASMDFRIGVVLFNKMSA